ncbi:MAG: acyl-CoA dehydrogenase family protein [candidate division WOR-3 bacterium]
MKGVSHFRESDIRAAAREFVRKEFQKVDLELIEKGKFPFELLKKACELGMVGITIDEEYGGSGFGILEQALIAEEFWKEDPDLGSVLLSAYGVEVVQKFGNYEQKRYYLPKVVSGNLIIAVIMPDLQQRKGFVRYGPLGNKFIINANCEFVINASHADAFLIVAEHTDVSSCHTTFLLPKQDLIKVQSCEQKLCARAIGIDVVSIKELPVTAEHLIGKEGEGSLHLELLINLRKLYTTAFALGVTSACLDYAARYVRLREQFNMLLSRFSLVQEYIGEIMAGFQLLNMAFYGFLRSTNSFEEFLTPCEQLLLINAFAKEMAMRSAAIALQLHGGYGFILDFPIEKYYRNAQFLFLWDGHPKEDKIKAAKLKLGVTD